ncbi:MAG: CDP-diacylglycerol--serine O-phosphatidyltransferase [Helicobacter sp.]|nr:CDP-diacylglycerol--serine O-phosphatidyltransferase [Helicobacter sp.]
MRIDPLYILPNLFTGASIYLGVLSIIFAYAERFELACWLILLCLIFDGLDGRVARLTGTASKFGVEFDSLADVVAFGVAPALILFFYSGFNYGKVGVLVCGLYTTLGAVRLARFNVTSSQNEPNVFIGLPIPSAAVFIVSWLLLMMKISEDYPEILLDSIHWISNFLMFGSLAVALLMVSNIRYPSFKTINFKGMSFSKILICLLIVLAVLFLFPVYMIVCLITLYVIFGPLRAGYYILKRKFYKH